MMLHSCSRGWHEELFVINSTFNFLTDLLRSVLVRLGPRRERAAFRFVPRRVTGLARVRMAHLPAKFMTSGLTEIERVDLAAFLDHRQA
jgi:hypothetical protein